MPKPKNLSANPSPEHDENFIRQVHAAMLDRGWLVPMDEDEVVKAEAELQAYAPTLPPELNEPSAVFERAKAGPPNLHVLRQQRLPFDNDAEASLAHAAREGKELSEEVLEKMRRDRRKAEREALLESNAEL